MHQANNKYLQTLQKEISFITHNFLDATFFFFFYKQMRKKKVNLKKI